MSSPTVTRTFLAALLLASAATAACKSKPADQATPGSAAVVEPAAPATPPAPPPGDPEIVELPTAVPTALPQTATIDGAMLATLSKMRLHAYGLHPQTAVHSTDVNVVNLSNERPKVRVDVQVGPCSGCLPMTAAAWKPAQEGLQKALISPKLIGLPDTEIAWGTDTIGGKPVITLRYLGETHSDAGGSYANVYVVYYNDGANFARVVSAYADDLATKDNMLKMVPLDYLKRAASEALLSYWAQLPTK